MTPRAVITGLGAVTPLGNDRESTWQALLKGASGIEPITAFDAAGLPTQIAGEVKGFDPVALVGAGRAGRMARFSQLAVAAAREAVADAGLAISPASAGRAAVVVNCAVAGMTEVEAAVRRLGGADPARPARYFVPSVIPSMAACEVAIDLGVRGPVTASALACASGIYALLEARRLIACGEADVVICGGTDSSITPLMFAGLSSLGAMSRRNGEPGRASRPFDADRDGFVYGEGAVLAVVESASHARRRGARAYAGIAGGALTCDAYHVSAPEPTAAGAAAAIGQALRAAGRQPADIDFICAHGTATRASDRAESAAIRLALGAHAGQAPVSAPKSMTGHLVGASGALSAMVCALAMRDGMVPPTINLDTPDPQCDLNHVRHEARPAAVRAALINAFGVGGQNCAAVLTSLPAASGAAMTLDPG